MQGIALTEQAKCGREYSLSTLLPVEYSQIETDSDLTTGLSWTGLPGTWLCVPVVQLPSCVHSSSFLAYGIGLMGKNRKYFLKFPLSYWNKSCLLHDLTNLVPLAV